MSSTTAQNFLSTWALQMNYPLIKVELSQNMAQPSTTFKFEQERFYLAIEDEEYNPIFTSPYKSVSCNLFFFCFLLLF